MNSLVYRSRKSEREAETETERELGLFVQIKRKRKPFVPKIERITISFSENRVVQIIPKRRTKRPNHNFPHVRTKSYKTKTIRSVQ
jgi:hypothetical protein